MTSAVDATDATILAYSPLSFLREHGAALEEHELERRRAIIDDPAVVRTGVDMHCWTRALLWDSDHFGFPVHRVELTDSPRDAAAMSALAGALGAAAGNAEQAGSGRWYLFGEVPAEDPLTVQAYGLAGFRLVETRATYFRELDTFDGLARHRVRRATTADIDNLTATAAGTPNRYDRYHADPFFTTAEADRYLGTYAAESVRGLADFVVVPAEGDVPPNAFFTARITRPPRCPVGLNHICEIALGVGRIPLVAVGPARTGWHVRLLAETTRLFRDEGLDVAVMTTQVVNRAVVHNCERLGYRLGRVTHVFAASSPPGAG